MSSIFRDLRYAIRMLFNSPGISIIAIVALALGIGVTTTMYSIVYGALLRGLPFEDGNRIYTIDRIDVIDGDHMSPSIHDYLDWRERQTSFEDLGGLYTGTINIVGTDSPDRYDGAFMSANSFNILGVRAALGRTFLEDEDSPDAELVVVLSHHVWRDRYGSDREVVGRVIRANGEQATIVGVMPEGFLFPVLQDVWVPLRLDALELPRGNGIGLSVFGRLRADADLDQAQAEFDAIQAQIAAEFPDLNENIGISMRPYVQESIGEEAVTMLWTMLGAVFFVLLIACANVANLLVSRAFDRNKEVAIRTALGANRGRVVMQILIEAGVLAVVGSLLGIALAMVGVDWFRDAISGTGAPFFIDIRVDAPILLFVLGVTTLATIFAGTLPALQVTRGNLNEILSDESRGSSSFRMGRLSRGLVVAQVALSCALLVGAGLMIRSVVNLGTADYGFDPDEILTARVGLFVSEYPDVDSRLRFFDDLLRRLEDHPATVAATLTTNLPVSQMGNRRFRVEGETYADDDDRPDANAAIASRGLFETYGIEVTRGRDFDDTDTATSLPVIIVNETFIERYMEGRDPLGKRIAFSPAASSEDRWHTIVGVVPDLFMDGPLNESPDGFYIPLPQADARFISIAVRTRGEPLAFTPALRQEVMSVDVDMPIYWVRTMTGHIEEQTWFYWVFGSLFGAFGSVALLLASVGLYGVMSFAVRRRTAEVGIRMALGARASSVLALVMRQGLFQLGFGLAIGLLMATGLAQLMEVLLFQVEPTDATTFVSISLTLLATGIVASLIPALRASRVDPIIALRNQ